MGRNGQWPLPIRAGLTYTKNPRNRSEWAKGEESTDNTKDGGQLTTSTQKTSNATCETRRFEWSKTQVSWRSTSRRRDWPALLCDPARTSFGRRGDLRRRPLPSGGPPALRGASPDDLTVLAHGATSSGASPTTIWHRLRQYRRHHAPGAAGLLRRHERARWPRGPRRERVGGRARQRDAEGGLDARPAAAAANRTTPRMDVRSCPRSTRSCGA